MTTDKDRVALETILGKLIQGVIQGLKIGDYRPMGGDTFEVDVNSLLPTVSALLSWKDKFQDTTEYWQKVSEQIRSDERKKAVAAIEKERLKYHNDGVFKYDEIFDSIEGGLL